MKNFCPNCGKVFTPGHGALGIYCEACRLKR